jgi:hypothetical protein
MVHKSGISFVFLIRRELAPVTKDLMAEIRLIADEME